ncbi:LapA family protein [Micromonospora maritima]|uniref:LapA family protein n=1 Tax=Micromonospora maritima TaxID=986711 RepID=UPI00157D1A0D|nr:LapA family protein [Micromonospora maritima]
MARSTSSARTVDAQSGPDVDGRARPEPGGRTGRPLAAVAGYAVLLLLLLIFILMNGQRAEVHFFGAQGRLPMGVALLLAVVFGVLLVTTYAAVRRIVRPRRSHRLGSTEPGAGTPEGRH